jgi:hypothetical protein
MMDILEKDAVLEREELSGGKKQRILDYCQQKLESYCIYREHVVIWSVPV